MKKWKLKLATMVAVVALAIPAPAMAADSFWSSPVWYSICTWCGVLDSIFADGNGTSGTGALGGGFGTSYGTNARSGSSLNSGYAQKPGGAPCSVAGTCDTAN